MNLPDFYKPQVMAIVNATPDSFYSASRTDDTDSLERRIADVVAQGATIIDIGGYSSRPGLMMYLWRRSGAVSIWLWVLPERLRPM